MQYRLAINTGEHTNRYILNNSKDITIMQIFAYAFKKVMPDKNIWLEAL